MRSCVVCGNKTSKAELVRIVATPGGSVRVDSTGKAAGRGAYVCKGRDCGPEGLKRTRLVNALRTALSDGDWKTLSSYHWPSAQADGSADNSARISTEVMEAHG